MLGQTSEGQTETYPGKVCWGRTFYYRENSEFKGMSHNCMFAEWHMGNLDGSQFTVRGSYMSSKTSIIESLEYPVKDLEVTSSWWIVIE